MRISSKRLQAVAALLALAVAGSAVQAQQAAPKNVSPELGTLAPDFALVGATRYGVLRDSVRLSDYRGKTIVLAFFFKARTKG